MADYFDCRNYWLYCIHLDVMICNKFGLNWLVV